MFETRISDHEKEPTIYLGKLKLTNGLNIQINTANQTSDLEVS